MRLRFTAQAFDDLETISNYIRERNPSAAEKVRVVILVSLELLMLFPDAGRRQTVEGVRKLVTRNYGYLVYYRVDRTAGEIVILSVRHRARGREHEDR